MVDKCRISVSQFIGQYENIDAGFVMKMESESFDRRSINEADQSALAAESAL